jgi:hypothetical protein
MTKTKIVLLTIKLLIIIPVYRIKIFRIWIWPKIIKMQVIIAIIIKTKSLVIWH